MDWIEQLFGINPDAGSGALEALLPVALVAALVGIGLAASRAARRGRLRR
ncbi:MAG: hypothetical protein M3O91_10340 [Chloroflexota bacterium]|nr:hypothetical protein [Chloroflexota bacterium]